MGGRWSHSHWSLVTVSNDTPSPIPVIRGHEGVSGAEPHWGQQARQPRSQPDRQLGSVSPDAERIVTLRAMCTVVAARDAVGYGDSRGRGLSHSAPGALGVGTLAQGSGMSTVTETLPHQVGAREEAPRGHTWASRSSSRIFYNHRSPTFWSQVPFTSYWR